MKKKIIEKVSCMFLAIIMAVSFAPSISAKAQIGPTAATKQYTKQHIATYYSYKECKKVIKNCEQINRYSNWGSILLGAKSAPAALVLSVYGYKMSTAASVFKKAVKKHKGVEFSYDYYISNISYSLNYSKNQKITYR